MRIFAFFALAACLLASTVEAASLNQPIYRIVKLEPGWTWQDGLELSFQIDEIQCKKYYGNKWREKCSFSIGRPGFDERKIKLSPNVPGNWHWMDGNRARFTPDKADSLKPATSYTADLSDLYLPEFFKIDKNKITATTLPLAVRNTGINFWIDPSLEARHKLSATFEFNYPVSNKNINSALNIPQNIIATKNAEVWNEIGDRLNISWTMDKLNSEGGEAQIIISDVAQIEDTGRGPQFIPKSEQYQGACFRQNIPGNHNLFSIKNIQLAPHYDDNLNRSVLLAIETSLYASYDNLLNNLQIWQLPKYNGPEASIPYNWQAAPAIAANTLKNSKKINPVPLQKDNLNQSRFTFQLNLEDESYILLKIDRSFYSASGNKLKEAWFGILQAPGIQARLGFLQPGNVLPLNESGIVDLYATDVDKIIWSVAKVRDPFYALLAQNSSNFFSEPNISLEMDTISQICDGEIKFTENVPGKAKFFALNLKDILKKIDGGNNQSGLNRIELKGYKNGEEIAWANRIILATNLGLIVKTGINEALDCFVSSFNTGEPVADVKVTVLGANGVPVIATMTDDQGHAKIPSLKGLKRENAPVAIIAEKGGNLAWLSLKDKARELDYSDFPTGGNYLPADGVNLFVFSQRGIYRPGEILKFGCLGRDQDFSILPENTPLFAELLDPAGRKVWETNFKSGNSGIALFEWQSSITSFTGKYILNIRTAKKGDIYASCTVRIEEFIPETLKLKLETPEPEGWIQVNPDNLPKIKMHLQNLYGTPAAKHKIRAKLSTSPAILKFANYSDFIFTDNAPFLGNGQERDLDILETSQEGEADYTLPAELFGKASAQVTVHAEGFDAGGGRGVAATKTFIASPMEKVLGWRLLNSLTNLDFVLADEKAELEFISLNSDLKKVNWPDITFSISRKRYITSLVSDGNGGYRYDNIPVNNPIKTWKQDVETNGTRIQLLNNEPGEYLLAARDINNTIIAQVPYMVAGNCLLSPDMPLGNSRMRLHLDKTNYEPGDKINLSLSLPYSGHGLIAIEREGVKTFKWFAAEAGDSIQQIEIPPDFEGKGYVTVAFARSQSSHNLYMDPLAYSVAPFTANMSGRDMNLKINAPEQARPGKNLEITIKASAKGQAVVFAVDEGILQLDNYQTPRPIKILLADRALNTKTLQILDLLMPEHALITARTAAFGGGMDNSAFGIRFQNPFRRKDEPPIVFWSSLIDVSDKEAKLEIPIPDYYTGKIRIMCIGSGSETVGSCQTNTNIIAPLILKPQFPLAVSPDDEFEGYLIVENTSAENLNLNLKMKSEDAFDTILSLPQTASIDPKTELVLPIKLKARDKLGNAAIHFEATGGLSAECSCSISIRPASALKTTTISGMVDESTSLSNPRKIYLKNASSTLLLSATPFPLLNGLSKFLETYPHGCTEQLISRSFALLLTRQLPNDIAAKDRQALFEAAFSAIRERFNGDGLGLWPNSPPDLLLTAYAADFLLTMKEAGLGIPGDLLSQLCQAIEYNCMLNDSDISAARSSAYAIWVLTREGRITTQLLENLIRALNERNVKNWKDDLTAVLIAASQRHMHINVPIPLNNIQYDPEGWFDEYAQISLHMTLLGRYSGKAIPEETRKAYFDKTMFALNEKNYATFSACQGIRGLLSCDINAISAIFKANISCNDPQNEEIAEIKNGVLSYKTEQCNNYKLQLLEHTLPLYWQIITTGYDKGMPGQKDESGIIIDKQYLNANGEVVGRIKQGEQITIAVTVRSSGSLIKDSVITDLLPGGLEMMFPAKSESIEDNVKHIDRREDRMIIFTDILNQPQTFYWKARAVTPGIFHIPSASAEAMYNQNIYGNTSSGKIEIVK